MEPRIEVTSSRISEEEGESLTWFEPEGFQGPKRRILSGVEK
jgi:hypothetical protein